MKIMKSTCILVIAFTVSAVLASCVSTNREIPLVREMLKEASGQNGRACVHPRDIRGYGVLNHDVVSIDAGRRYFLATVLPGCTDLDTSIRAVFRSHSFDVCGGGMDNMITPKNNCIINQIFEFNNRQEAFAVYDEVIEQRKILQNELKK